MASLRKTIRGGAVGVLGAVLLLAGAAPARAQESIVVSTVRYGPGTGQAGPITKRGVERYCELLEFTSEQASAAMALLEGYQVGRRAADEVRLKAHQAAIKELREQKKETDPELLTQVNKDHLAEITRLEKSFFDDLRALCSGPAQDSNWARVERARRREVELRHGAVSGEAVDLFALVHQLKLAPGQMREVRPLLEAYEVEVDGHLKARQRIAGETPAFDGGKVSFEDVKKRLADMRDAGVVIRDLNERHERKIAAALPEERRAEFHQAYLMASYPAVYRKSPATRHIEAGLALKDLTASQREHITAAKAAYERDARPLNEAWVKEVQAGDMLEFGDWLYPSSAGNPVLLHLDKGEKPPEEAAKARRALDQATVERVVGVLSDEQRAAVSVGEKEQDVQPPGDGDTE